MGRVGNGWISMYYQLLLVPKEFCVRIRLWPPKSIAIQDRI